MKKVLFYLTVLFASINVWSQAINKTGGWMESAFVEWAPVAGADSYNVYYTGESVTNQKIDEPLIRSYNTYFRADVLGLAPGTYTITVKPVTGGVEATGTTTSAITVLAHDRTGFAFQGGRIPGGYNLDGTLKANTNVIYITKNTKNTVSLNVTGAEVNPCIGLQAILDGYKKGKETRPLVVRLVGNITTPNYTLNGDIVIENKNFASSSITFEGVGSDAVANGWGLRVKNASNIEVRNLGFMLTAAEEGDNVGLQQGNDHIWVHNCDLFYGAAGGDADQIKGDGAMDAKLSTYVTFSYNHFWDSGKCNLLGLSEDTVSGLYITYHHNWYDHSDSRHPRVRFYSAHVYNNYYDGNSKYGAGSTMGSSVFMEGNFFRNCKYPMLTSLQGSDVYSDPTGGFSGEGGGSIKAFNNIMSGQTRYVPYNATTNPIEFDAIETATRGEVIPSTITPKAKYLIMDPNFPKDITKGTYYTGFYNNFDTDPALYIKNLVIDEPAVAKDKVMLYSGRVSGGDLKYTFNNAVDDASSALNINLKNSLTSYKSGMLYIQGETPEVVNTQTLTSSNNDQSVKEGEAISNMVFTWGGDATDANVPESATLAAAGISITKIDKTITISGTPTADVSFTVVTSGTSGTPVTLPGNIIVLPNNFVPNDEILNFSATPAPTVPTPVGSFYSIIGGINSTAGATTYDTFSLTRRLKIESSTRITYTTTYSSTLILVFDPTFAGNIKLTSGTDIAIAAKTTSYTATKGIVIITDIAPGTYTISKGDTTNLYFIKTTYRKNLGTEDNVKAPKLTLYPNPTTNQLYFSSSDQKIENVAIYSLSGALIKNISTVGESIDVSNLSTGSYLVKVTTEQGSFTQKIIKK
ncbi:MAG TPA: T9SS type A sorting domain-containing protein [Flavobacterium sp.]